MPSDAVAPGQNKITFDNGDYYIGKTLDNQPHGLGKRYYANGMVLSSNWQYGLPVTTIMPDSKIPGYGNNKFQNTAIIGGKIFSVGYGYTNEIISQYFGVSGYIRGIRVHHDKAVLYSVENSVYKDGNGWELDDDGEYVFVYTGEGLTGDQQMTRGNFFLKNSGNKGVYLFVKRRTNDYVFYGTVGVKRVEETYEPDKYGNRRLVFKFILRRL